jgi:hypothetical protein
MLVVGMVTIPVRAESSCQRGPASTSSTAGLGTVPDPHGLSGQLPVCVRRGLGPKLAHHPFNSFPKSLFILNFQKINQTSKVRIHL